jgi:DNA-binding IclR family transcriptional regulator
MGKAILAARPFEEVESIYTSSFAKLTANTVPDLSALKEELTQCQKAGWAIEHGQSSNGYSCLAVALSDQFPPINSLSISMQTKALTNKYRDMLLPELFSLAKKIIS